MKNKKTGLFLGILIILGLLMTSIPLLSHAENVLTSSPSNNCIHFEYKVKTAREKIQEDLKNNRITQEEANEDLAYIDKLESNFEKGVLPRELNPRRKFQEDRGLNRAPQKRHGRHRLNCHNI